MNGIEKERLILFYKDVLESFFTVNYPLVAKDKFWVWFNKMLLGIPKNITDLDCLEQDLFLNKLNELGNLVYDQKLISPKDWR